MADNEEKVQELLRELMVAKADYDDLSKKLTRIGQRIHRQYKKLSALLNKEK